MEQQGKKGEGEVFIQAFICSFAIDMTTLYLLLTDIFNRRVCNYNTHTRQHYFLSGN